VQLPAFVQSEISTESRPCTRPSPNRCSGKLSVLPELRLRDGGERPVRGAENRMAVDHWIVASQIELHAVHPLDGQFRDPAQRRRRVGERAGDDGVHDVARKRRDVVIGRNRVRDVRCLLQLPKAHGRAPPVGCVGGAAVRGWARRRLIPAPGGLHRHRCRIYFQRKCTKMRPKLSRSGYDGCAAIFAPCSRASSMERRIELTSPAWPPHAMLTTEARMMPV